MGPNIALRVQKMRATVMHPYDVYGNVEAPVVLKILRFQPISFLFDMVVS